MNKAVLRYKEDEKTFFCFEQNGTKEIIAGVPSYWIEITQYNEVQGNTYYSISSQELLRKYWIKETRLCTDKELHEFLIANKDFRFHKFLKKIPYSIFVKEW